MPVAWTSAEALSRWSVVDPAWTVTARNELRVGGAFCLEMDRHDGTVFVCWASRSVPAINQSRVTIELRRHGWDGTSTRLVLVHDRLPETPEGRAHHAGREGILTSLQLFRQ